MQRVDVDGHTIAFERAGAGPALVLLHGGLSDHREWRRQLSSLADAFDVIAWDAPGCGGSSDPPATFTIADYGRTLAAFLDEIEVDAADTVGLSFGSTLALELSRQRPELVRSLILAAPYAGWAGSLPADEIAARVAGADAMLARPASGWAGGFVDTLVGDDAPTDLRDELLAIVSEARPAGARPMLHAMADADLRGILPEISVPTLLLAGGRDVRSGASIAETLHAAIGTSRLETIHAAGHQMNMETPDAFERAVRAFLVATR